MPVYSYKASDRTGKLLEGIMEARDADVVIRRLQEQSLYPIDVSAKAAKKKNTGDLKTQLLNRLTETDRVRFTTQLATLINAGLPLERCLNIMTEISPSSMKSIATEVLRNVQGGSSFADALGKHPKAFSRLYVNMVKAGEAGGVLELVLQRLADYMEEMAELKGAVVNALIYPLFLVLVGGGAVTVLLTYVLPKFTPMFEDMGIAIPFYTQILLYISEFLRGYWWAVLGGIAVTYLMFRQYVNTETGRQNWDSIQLRLPVFGDLITKVEVARFARTLGTLSNSGVPILNALMIVKDLVDNVVLADAINVAYTDIKEGGGVAEPLAKSGLFPEMAIHMMRVGEETGSLEEMLLKVSSVYEIEVRNALKRAVGLIEPVLIIIMGLVVGFIVASMISAIMSVNDLSI